MEKKNKKDSDIKEILKRKNYFVFGMVILLALLFYVITFFKMI